MLTIILFFRLKNRHPNERSFLTHGVSRSQKPLDASTCSNISQIHDVFGNTDLENSPFHKSTNSSSPNDEYIKFNSSNYITDSLPLPRSTIPKSFIRTSANQNNGPEPESVLSDETKVSKKQGNENALEKENIEDTEAINSISEVRRLSSGIFEASSPLLANRRKRSSVGLISSRCRTRSGRTSARIKSSGKTRTRPSFVANTLVNHTLSPKLSTFNDRAEENMSGGGRPTKSKKPRCSDCRKRLNITNMFICRCEKQFCAKHRHAESHFCSFDYKADGKKYLEKANPFIPIPKLPKI